MDIYVVMLIVILAILAAFLLLSMGVKPSVLITGGKDAKDTKDVKDVKYIIGKNMFDKMIIGDFLGAGAFGSVYSVIINGKKYALKREKYAEGISTDLGYLVKITTLLSKSTAGKYFSKLYACRVIGCNYIYDSKYDELAGLRKRLSSSGKCSDMIMSYCDSTLTKILDNKLSKREQYKLAYQLIESMIHSGNCGVLMNDIDITNIMYDSSSKNIVHIDFGGWVSINDLSKFSENDKNIFINGWNYNCDLLCIIEILTRWDKLFIKDPIKPDCGIDSLIKSIKDANDYDKLMNYLHEIYKYSSYKPSIDLEMYDNWPTEIVKIIWSIINPDAYKKLLEKSYKHVEINKPIISNKDLLYILDNYWNLPLVLDHLNKYI